MNRRLPLLAVIGFAFGVLGCGRDQDKTPDGKKNKPYVEVNEERIKEDMAAFRVKAEATLKEVDGQLETLKAKAAKAGEDLKAKLQPEIEQLKAMRDKASNRLAEIRDATQENWPEVRGHLSNALDDLKKGFSKALSSFE